MKIRIQSLIDFFKSKEKKVLNLYSLKALEIKTLHEMRSLKI